MQAPVNKSGRSVLAVILMGVILGSAIGISASYSFANSTDSNVQTVRADLRAVADAAGIPIGNQEEMKKLMDERKVIEAAKQEGKLVVYATGDTRIQDAQRAAFERKYPFITVEFVYAPPPVHTRFIDEFGKGVKSADIVGITSATVKDVLGAGELLAKYVPKDSEWVPAYAKDKDGRWTSAGPTLWSIMYNTKLVSKDQAPKSFKDLLDPKWKGKIVAITLKIPEGGTGGVGNDIWMTFEKQYGEDFIRQLLAQNIRFYETGPQARDAVAKGEFPISLYNFLQSTEAIKSAGQPVDWVRLSDNTYLQNFGGSGIASSAPHPNAAKLWMDFAFSKEAVQISADVGSTLSYMPGIRYPNPDSSPEGKKLVVIEDHSVADRKAFLAKYPALAP